MILLDSLGGTGFPTRGQILLGNSALGAGDTVFPSTLTTRGIFTMYLYMADHL